MSTRTVDDRDPRAVYLRVKARLDFTRSEWVSVAMLAVDAALFATGAWLVLSGGTWRFLLAQPIFATVFFRSFGMLHEAGHGNCSSRRWLNTLVGHWASLWCFTPFFPWKRIHQEHHVWAGNAERDPTARNVKVWRQARRVPWLVRMAWRSWIPLAAFAQHLVFWTYPLVLLRRDRSRGIQCAASVLLLPVGYAALCWTWPALFAPVNFAPAFVLYLFTEELVNLPHHSDLFHANERLALWEQWRATRSCYYPRGISEFFVLNFNFHTEHHFYPSLPWHRLRHARTLVKDSLGDNYKECVGISWNLRNRSRSIERLLFATEEH